MTSEERTLQCYPFATLYDNKDLTIYFENSVLQKFVNETTKDKISVCSWALQHIKLKMYIGRPRPLTQELLESNYDVLSFTKNTKNHQFFAFANRNHPNFADTFRKMLNAAGLKMPSKVKDPIYQNHFSCRSDIYKDYVKTYLTPCMEVIKNDPEINKLAMVDSNYSQLSRMSTEMGEYLKEKIGVSYYPLVPFLLERLFSVYCQNNRINVTYL